MQGTSRARALGAILRGGLVGALLGVAVGAVEGSAILLWRWGEMDPRLPGACALLDGAIGAGIGLLGAAVAALTFLRGGRGSEGPTGETPGEWQTAGPFTGMVAVIISVAVVAALPLRSWIGAGRAFSLLIAAVLVVGGAWGVMIAVGRSIGRWEGARRRGAWLTVRRCAALALGALLVSSLLAVAKSRRTPLEGSEPLRTSSAAAPPPRPGDPHIVLIVLDTVRPDHLSCYGYPRPTSPTIDSLAASGALFRHAVATSSHSHPSHASLLTGTYPPQHGVRAMGQYLDEGNVTLAEWLRAMGYWTAGVSANLLISPRFGFGQGFNVFLPLEGGGRGRRLARYLALDGLGAHLVRPTSSVGQGFLIRILEAVHPGLAEQALDPRPRGADVVNQVGGILARRDRSRPLFLFLNFLDAHWPYNPPQVGREMLGEVGELEAGQWDPITILRDHRMADKGIGSFLEEAGLSNGEIREVISRHAYLYDCEVRYLDFQMASLINLLRREGILDRTLLVVTSDHGEQFGEHGLFGHRNSLYESLLHVPLIIAGAGMIAPEVIPGTVSQALFMPAILGLVEDRPWEKAGPIHLSPVLASLDRGLPYAEQRDQMHAIYRGGWKLIWHATGPPLLFHLESDPGEESDLATAEPDTAAALLAALEARRTEVARGGIVGRSVQIPQTLREELRALGYVQ